MTQPMNQVLAARYIGQNFDVSKADHNNAETWTTELIVAMDVLNVSPKNRWAFVRNAKLAYNA